MRCRYLVNPAAARGRRGARGLGALEDWARKHTGGFDAIVASDRDDAVTRVRAALAQGVKLLVAVGGDGTVNTAMNGFFDDKGQPIAPDAALAIAPWGTGCDYFRTVGGSADWRELLLAGRSRAVDVGRVTYGDGRLVHFVNAASVGLSAEVVRRQRASPAWLPPLVSYSLPALTGLVGFRPIPLTITLDGRAYGGDFLSAFFAKGTFLGGGMRFGGNVTLSDGRLDVTLLHGMTLRESLPRFGKIYTGRFHGDTKITKATAAEIEITAPRPQPIEFDGELVGTTDVRITVLPGALRVLGG